MSSELNITTSWHWEIRCANETWTRITNPERSHNRLHVLGIQFKNAVQNGNLIVPQRLFSWSMELEERFQLRLLIKLMFIRSKNVVQEFGDWICNGRWEKQLSWGKQLKRNTRCHLPRTNIMIKTKGAHVAPTYSPYRTLIAWGITLQSDR